VTDTPAAARPGAQTRTTGERITGACLRRLEGFGRILRLIRRRYGTTAFIWYAIVGVFSVAYGIARLAWPHLPERETVVVGLLAAGPLTWILRATLHDTVLS